MGSLVVVTAGFRDGFPDEGRVGWLVESGAGLLVNGLTGLGVPWFAGVSAGGMDKSCAGCGSGKGVGTASFMVGTPAAVDDG